MEIQDVRDYMVEYYRGDPKRMQHFLKVHQFARWIGEKEDVGEERLFSLEVAAYMHDIGIKVSEEKYHSSAGTYQEIEGPPLAEAFLKARGCAPDFVQHICEMIGSHHHYKNIKDPDLQILIEADFLVNAYEEECSMAAIQNVRDKVFRTSTGIWLLNTVYGLE